MSKKKIIFVMNNFLVGGVEKLLFDIISCLDKEKYDINIITVFGTGPLENSFRHLGIPIYFSGPSGLFSRKLPFKLYWLLIAPITLIRITFFLFKSKPDVVVSSLYQADVISMTAAKIAGIKKRILIQHDVVHFFKFRHFIKKNFALKFSTQIISVSETVKDFLVKHFKVDSQKITIIYNGIDYKCFAKGKKLVSSREMPVMGIIGRLEEIKGHGCALEALKILKEKHNLSPVVLLAGDGTLRGILNKYVIENNLNSVKFLGSIDDVPKFLSQVDILIVPSKDEGFGLVVLEGIVARKVVIASDLPVFKELIQSGKNGIFFKANNSINLADVLLEFIQHPNFIKNYQKNIDLWINQVGYKYDLHYVVNEYQKLLG